MVSANNFVFVKPSLPDRIDRESYEQASGFNTTAPTTYHRDPVGKNTLNKNRPSQEYSTDQSKTLPVQTDHNYSAPEDQTQKGAWNVEYTEEEAKEFYINNKIIRKDKPNVPTQCRI